MTTTYLTTNSARFAPAQTRQPARSWAMNLRFAGKCRACSAIIPAGVKATYDSATKAVFCLDCTPDDIDAFLAVKAAEHVVKAQSAEITTKNPIKDGTYTVILDGEETYRTIRIKTEEWTNNYLTGQTKTHRVASYLSGSDNEESYTRFAFLNDNGFKVWSKYADKAEYLKAALQVLADPEGAGERYALESGNCYRCNKKLTVPASIHRGLGPICAGRE